MSKGLLILHLLFLLLFIVACELPENGHSGSDRKVAGFSKKGRIHFPRITHPYFETEKRLVPVYDDSRLRAASGFRIITPDDVNHPCPKYMAGTSQNRISTGTHNDLEARGLLLSQGKEYLYLVSVDLLGLSLGDVHKAMDILEQYGLNRNRIIISSTHTHEGPDTIGLWGPSFYETGRCPEYIDFLMDEIVDMALELSKTMVPVTPFAAETFINEPEADHPNLMSDSRFPYVYNEHLTSIRFSDDTGRTVATLVNWQSHPECMIGYKEFSSDFPRWIRLKMEQEFGGTSIYISGTVGGLINPLHHNVPERTETGQPVTQGGNQVFISDNNDVKAWSLGYVVAEWAIDSLVGAPPAGYSLSVNTTQVQFPIISPMLIGAILAGLVEGIDDEYIVRDNPGYCGFFGCFVQTIHHIKLGDLHMISLPGEALPELAVGRQEHEKDWGQSWGIHTYPPITGYRELIPDGDLVIDIGLANNEMGYILPADDFERIDHPNHYEEIYFFSFRTEQILRDAIASLILKTKE